MGSLPTGQELHLRSHEGRILIALLEWRIQMGVDGQFVQCHCVLHEISERKRMEAVDLKAVLDEVLTIFKNRRNNGVLNYLLSGVRNSR